MCAHHPQKGFWVKEVMKTLIKRLHESHTVGQAFPAPLLCGCTANLQEEAVCGTSQAL